MEEVLIYCITQPLENYNTKIMGIELGLWKNYANRPGVFALISLTTPLLYQWEKGSPVADEDKIVRLEAAAEAGMEAFLELEVEGWRVSQMLDRVKDPLEFFDKWRPEIVSLCLKHPLYTPSQVDMIMKARVLSWVKAHKIPGWNNYEALYKGEEKAVKENAYAV